MTGLLSFIHTAVMSKECISVNCLTKSYGGVKAVDGITFSVRF